MQELAQTTPTPIVYLVDTNVFRYYAYRIGDTNSPAEALKLQYQVAAKAFFRKALAEARDKKAIVIVSAETRQELLVQAHTLKKESSIYMQLLNSFPVEEAEIPQHLEYMLRDFSNYIRGKYQHVFAQSGLKTNYLQTSDARILIHALINQAVIVTANTKDFFFYSLFFESPFQQVLLPISNDINSELDCVTRSQLQCENKFIAIREEINKLFP
ncbi:MAG: hypothetical protein ACRC5C_09215 [Bacilli bacterium]